MSKRIRDESLRRRRSESPEYKSFKSDTLADPSCVIHLSNVPPVVQDEEIALIGLAFGDVTSMLYIRSKKQAFLQFGNLADAQAMVIYFTRFTALLDGKHVFAQYSNHKELSINNDNRNVKATQLALERAKELREIAEVGSTDSVLRVSVHNIISPVTMDTIYQIFNKFGTILKIVISKREESVDIFIQMKDARSARRAYKALNHQNIYNGYCRMEITFSKNQSLRVKYNNVRSRDFTNPTLLSSEKHIGEVDLSAGFAYSDAEPPINLTSLMRNRLDLSAFERDYDRNYDDLGYRRPLMALHSAIDSPLLLRDQLQLSRRHLLHDIPPLLQDSSEPLPLLRSSSSSRSRPPVEGRVLLVSNLNEEKATPDALFTLFGVYGDVHRVKILFNKKDTALVQMALPEQAEVALQYLDGVDLYGKRMKILFSKHHTVQLSKDGMESSGLTKDYVDSTLHRFKKPGSKNYMNIYPPSPTLHLSNISDDVTENDLVELFSRYGTVRNFKFFETDRRMALMHMNSVEDACAALIGTHNHMLSKGRFLRVSFSKPKLSL